jgi:3-methylcrotonyl-CoA carboxylase alpha subunit
MLAKLVVWSDTRAHSIQKMRNALRDFAILGVQTNIEFLERIVGSDDFASGAIDTHFIDRHRDLLKAASAEIPTAVLIAAGLSDSTQPKTQKRYEDVWRSGAWRNS